MSILVERSGEYKTWSLIISNYGVSTHLKYTCSLEFPSKEISGLDVFDADKYGRLVKDLYDNVFVVIRKFSPNVVLTDII